jgi:hypothetical protein
MNRLYVNNTTLIELRDLRSAKTGGLISDAVVVVTITDKEGGDVQVLSGSDLTWPHTMEPVGDGDYRAEIPNELELELGTGYVAVIVATTNDGLVATWDVELTAVVRT